jgi:transcription antitermination factor NusG
VPDIGEALPDSNPHLSSWPEARAPLAPSDPLLQPCWYAVYSFPRHEKVVARHLEQQALEHYLPLYEALHRWKDRWARVQEPLFPGYLFVRIPLHDRFRVLNTPSVLRIVGTSSPLPLPDEEIEALRRSLQTRKATPCPYFTAGKRVRIASGPFEGMQGVVLRRKGKTRLIVSIDSIMRSVAFELEAADLRLAL